MLTVCVALQSGFGMAVLGDGVSVLLLAGTSAAGAAVPAPVGDDVAERKGVGDGVTETTASSPVLLVVVVEEEASVERAPRVKHLTKAFEAILPEENKAGSGTPVCK